jgi:anti-anti-sigma regulatory factor
MLIPGSQARRVRTWAMRDASALIATVDQAAGVATVTVRGEFRPSTYSRLQDRLVWAAENCPQRLVVDLGQCDRFTEQLITLIGAARRQLPVGCLLEIRSANPAVRKLFELAGWPEVRVTAAGREAGPTRLGAQGQA